MNDTKGDSILNKTERLVLREIEDWENVFFKEASTYDPFMYDRYIEKQFERMIPKEKKKQWFDFFDGLLFQLQAYVQNASFQYEAEATLLKEANVFDESIQNVYEMKNLSIHQLRFIAEQQMARKRLVSSIEGGLVGTGSFLFLTFDYPVLLGINIRMIQLIGMTYGYPMQHPVETVIVLKVLMIALVPERYRKDLWDDVLRNTRHFEDPHFYPDKGSIVDERWINSYLKQVVKAFVIMSLRKKLIQGIPLLGIGVGVYMNYRFASRVSEVAHHFYQKRLLLEK